MQVEPPSAIGVVGVGVAFHDLALKKLAEEAKDCREAGTAPGAPPT